MVGEGFGPCDSEACALNHKALPILTCDQTSKFDFFLFQTHFSLQCIWIPFPLFSVPH